MPSLVKSDGDGLCRPGAREHHARGGGQHPARPRGCRLVLAANRDVALVPFDSTRASVLQESHRQVLLSCGGGAAGAGDAGLLLPVLRGHLRPALPAPCTMRWRRRSQFVLFGRRWRHLWGGPQSTPPTGRPRTDRVRHARAVRGLSGDEEGCAVPLGPLNGGGLATPVGHAAG